MRALRLLFVVPVLSGAAGGCALFRPIEVRTAEPACRDMGDGSGLLVCQDGGSVRVVTTTGVDGATPQSPESLEARVLDTIDVASLPVGREGPMVQVANPSISACVSATAMDEAAVSTTLTMTCRLTFDVAVE
ncbi:hypothetical protein [Acuticoccus mangrovi]|uniref:Uncharacterized protein n=1 Tax=Acuticoccus mangrovi TaxID=2796142 RepID=A0A934IPK2_9HYPH|nr:hypothetical protein [Acuticoccus mangrovi]MBJ3775710.1 hypothetical protein [Acuticoccus mangrovi]